MSTTNDNKILTKVRIIVAEMPWNKILTFSFCLILSAIFWFILVYRENFNSTYNFPIQYSNVPENIIFEQKLPESINVTIRDNGYALFKYFFTKRTDSIHVDINNFLKSSSKSIQGAALEDIIRNELLPSSELVSYSPGIILLRHTSLAEKNIPVIFDGQIALASGYLLNGDISIEPDTIKVYGSKEILKSLIYAYTVSDTVNEFKSQEPLTYRIKSVDNLRFVPDEVKVYVPVDEYTQKDLDIPITCINLPPDLNVKFFPSSVKISFQVGLTKYSSITSNQFTIQFDYNELKSIQESHVPIRISSYPDHIQNLTMSNTEVEFIFEKN